MIFISFKYKILVSALLKQITYKDMWNPHIIEIMLLLLTSVIGNRHISYVENLCFYYISYIRKETDVGNK